MNPLQKNKRRVLAIDPATGGFGFAVLEGPERLVDWGVKGTTGDITACLIQIKDLMDWYEPEVLAVEDYEIEGSRRGLRARGLIYNIVRLARERKVKTYSFSRMRVKQTFYQFNAVTKHEIATFIARRLPELETQLPPLRRPWMSEDYRMSFFDAISFAWTFFYFESGRKRHEDYRMTAKTAGGINPRQIKK
jgi:Holliday junction resolvasome RuvABC endonuclease subunit